ncbi:MAG TPA: restriction endonuclease subunit S [Archangium sp.]|uniref:restriction endonuclease subunit S n=1 Tax=Archangium sp. TaxID=1872627 RepID=UPI002E34C0AB|nr:restriction endonuclease subunit S [Archangium sp.]HEX5747236.1 restriction endonuclease subunit S [Archangium sp.]
MKEAAWQKVPFGECVTLFSGGTPSKTRNEYWGGSIPWVSSKDLKRERIYTTDDLLTQEGVENGTRMVPTGTVLFVVRSMVLANRFPVSIAMRPVAFNQDIKAVACREFVLPLFIYYWLRANEYEILGRVDEAAHGTKRLQIDRLAAMLVNIPPLKVQRHIADILSAYDDLIENCEQRIRVLDGMARVLFREWFVLFRFPGHEKTPLVESPIGRIPKGWRVERAGGIACENRRGVPKGTLEDGPTRYVGLEHIPRRSLALDAWDETAELGSNKLRFEPGEVLFGKIRPYFHKVSVAPFSGVCSADTFVISAKAPYLRAFTTCLVSSDEFVAHASATANGAKMPRANWDVMMNFPVALPPPALLESFSALVEPWLACNHSLVFRVHNLRRTRDLLLPRLLSGQLYVEDAA